MIQVAEGATRAVTDMLQRMRELALQATSDSNTKNDRKALRKEFSQLVAEIGRISDNTQWNRTQLLDGSSYSSPAQFQIGSNANQTIDVALANLSHTSDSSVFGVDLSSIATETFSSSARYVMVQQNGVEQDIWISEIDIMSGGVDVANSATNSNVAITMHSHNVVIWDGWGGRGHVAG